MKIAVVLSALLGFTSNSFAQIPPTVREEVPADTLLVDTVLIRIIPHIGSAFPGMPPDGVRDSAWYWSGARTLPHVFFSHQEVFRFDLGNPGKPSTFMLGGSPSGWNLLSVDGRRMSSPVFGQSRWLSVPLEAIEQIEELSGPRALIANARWNLLTYQFSSPAPVTAVRFSQEPHETILSDAYFTQNIARSTSLLFGFQRMTSAGRFDNARLGSWNLRGRLRSNVSPDINILFTWNYEKTTNGLNGGVDRVNSPSLFDDVQAIVSEQTAYEILSREEFSLTGVFRVFSDSSSLTRIVLSQTDEEWEFNRPVASFYPRTRRFARGRSLEARFSQSLSLPYSRLLLGAAMIRDRSKGTESLPVESDDQSSVGAALDVLVADGIVPSIGFRVDRWNGEGYPGIAAEVAAGPFKGFDLRLTYERLSRFPSLQERFWVDSLLFRPPAIPVPNESVLKAKLRWTAEEQAEASFSLFRKSQNGRNFFFASSTPFGDPSILQSSSDLDWTGGSLSGKFRIGAFAFEGYLTALNVEGPDSLQQLLPPVWSRWEVSWQDRLLDGAFGLRFALRGTFFDRYYGLRPDLSSLFDVVERSYVARRITTLDAYSVFDIGDVFFSLAWENFLDTEYYRVASYPMPDRRLVLSVRWVFGD